MASPGPGKKKTAVAGAEHDGDTGQNEEETPGARPGETDDEALARALQVRQQRSPGLVVGCVLESVHPAGVRKAFSTLLLRMYMLSERVHNCVMCLLARRLLLHEHECELCPLPPRRS